MAYEHLGQCASAIELFEKRLNIVQEWDDKDGELEAHANLGGSFKSMGVFERATWHAQLQYLMNPGCANRSRAHQHAGQARASA